MLLSVFKDRPPSPPSRAQEILWNRQNNAADASKAKEQAEANNDANAEVAVVAADEDAPSDYVGSMKRLMTNPGYVLLLVTYGLNVGVFYAISTLLNAVVVLHFPGAEEDAGRIGLVIVICGMAGSMVCGIVLDKTHAYKYVLKTHHYEFTCVYITHLHIRLTTLLVYLFSFVGMVVYTLTFRFGQIEVIYFTASLLGYVIELERERKKNPIRNCL